MVTTERERERVYYSSVKLQDKYNEGKLTLRKNVTSVTIKKKTFYIESQK